MSKYGVLALAAHCLCTSEQKLSPVAAWKTAAKKVYPESVSLQKKGCPRGAFLGLCEAGYVVGIRPEKYTRSIKNKAYAIAAVEAFFEDSIIAKNPAKWWSKATSKSGISENGQLEVVNALRDKQLLQLPQNP